MSIPNYIKVYNNIICVDSNLTSTYLCGCSFRYNIHEMSCRGVSHQTFGSYLAFEGADKIYRNHDFVDSYPPVN